MVSYPNQFLYLTDNCGVPSELINGARLARNLEASQLCGNDLFDNILANGGCEALTYQPGVPSSLADAVFWIDAADASSASQNVWNKGTAGQILNPALGANTSVGTDEPLLLQGATNYLYTPAVAGNYASLPNTAALQITGDIEVIARVAMDDWTPSAAQTLVSKYLAGTSGYELFVDTSGFLNLVARVGAANVTGTSTVATGFTDGTTRWVRATRASATGTVTFYTAPDSDAIPTSWTQLGATAATTAGAIVSGTQIMQIGERTGAAQTAAAKFFRVVLRNAIGAAAPVNVAEINFTTNTSQSSFVAQAGTVTINRSTTGRKSVAYLGRPLWLFGTDDYMEVLDANADLLDFGVLDSFTVIAIARTHNIAVGAAGVMVGKQSSATTTGWSLTNGTAATSLLSIRDAATVSGTTANKTASVLSAIAGVRNVTADTVTGYLNGVAGTPTTDTTTATLANAVNFRIGIAAGGTLPYDGEIMAVMIWRRALTAAEIAEVSRWYTDSQTLGGSAWSAADLSSTGAPWYDSTVPASAEAFGFLIEEFTGLDGAHNKRNSYPTGMRQGGSYYGVQGHDGRVALLNVLLHGSSERGLNYLFEWLQDQLLSCCDQQCGTRQMWVRTVCPTSLTNLNEGLQQMKRVALLEGPTWEAPPVAWAGCYIRRVSFTLGIGDPCAYSPPVTVTGPQSASTAGVVSTASFVLADNSTWVGSSMRTVASIPRPPLGQNAPIVTITIPPGGAGATLYGVPMLRIAGYDDPNSTADPYQSFLLGELIIEAPHSAGYQIIADLASRTVSYNDLYGTGESFVNSGFIGAAVRSGVRRWWSTAGCNNAFVVVEPVYKSLQTLRTDATSYLKAVSSWQVDISYANRKGCC